MKQLEEYQLGTLTLKNRIVMGPMTRNRAGEGNVPHELQEEYYQQRSTAGLIISEATQISPQGVGYPNTPGIHTQDQVEGWKKVTETVHKQGSAMFLQLWHVGRVSHSDFHDGDLPVAPSAIPAEGQAFTPSGLKDFETPRALETDEIPGIIDDFERAAIHAKEAGFDGIEIHAANGYLINQFLENGSNKREDKYGGSVENRARLLFEVIDRTLHVWESEKIGVRLSPNGFFNGAYDSNPKEIYTYVLEKLNEYNLAYVHFVEEPKPEGEKYENYPESVMETYAHLYEGVKIVCGGMTKEKGEQLIEEGKADLIAYASKYIANPDLPQRFEKDIDLTPSDQSTWYGGGAEGYTDYAFAEAPTV
jgi:N-ethylmaleimide reductase